MCITSLYIAHDSVLYSHHGCLALAGHMLALCFALRVSGFGGPSGGSADHCACGICGAGSYLER